VGTGETGTDGLCRRGGTGIGVGLAENGIMTKRGQKKRKRGSHAEKECNKGG